MPASDVLAKLMGGESVSLPIQVDLRLADAPTRVIRPEAPAYPDARDARDHFMRNAAAKSARGTDGVFVPHEGMRGIGATASLGTGARPHSSESSCPKEHYARRAAENLDRHAQAYRQMERDANSKGDSTRAAWAALRAEMHEQRAAGRHTQADGYRGDVAKAGLGLSEPVTKSIPIFKAGEEEQRYVLGIVLVPEEVDSQGDVYSGEEVRQAAHQFMEEYQTVGVMHRDKAAPQVRVVESFCAPVDFAVGENTVKAGTWLLGIHVADDGLWQSVKAGELTGLSIGGSAVRRPVDAPDSAPEAAPQ